MKSLDYILFLFTCICYSQTAIQNNGNFQLHKNAKIGFHTNLINQGTIEDDENTGFVGFYSNDELRIVSGTNRPVFHNVEFDTENNTELQVSLGVTNELNFILGKVLTPRNNTGISLDFINHDFYANADNSSHVDGYTTVDVFNESFSFPIGDDNRLRPMILPAQLGNNFFKGGYFFEDPNSPSTFTSFNTNSKPTSISNISNLEFWDLDGNTETTITLTWDELSAVSLLNENIRNLRVVGWHINKNQWVDLGNTFVNGSTSNGRITSAPFIPDEYEVITIGAINNEDTAVNFNYLITPNGDNVNESLVIEEIKDYPYNKLAVYNRWGNLVYQKEGYTNEFRGQSDGRATINKKDNLPVGTYFYVVEFGNTKKLELIQKGWVYINR